MSTRTAALCDLLSWNDRRLGEYLKLDRSTVTRLRNGATAETGPVSRLLDMLAIEHGRADLTAEAFAVPAAPAGEEAA